MADAFIDSFMITKSYSNLNRPKILTYIIPYVNNKQNGYNKIQMTSLLEHFGGLYRKLPPRTDGFQYQLERRSMFWLSAKLSKHFLIMGKVIRFISGYLKNTGRKSFFFRKKAKK
jgi:hypothetical protein